MPEKIDSHQHFWSLQRADYKWLKPALRELYQDYQPEHLRPLLRAAGVQRTILVQAAATVAESKYLLRLARQNSFVAGVVGWIDMEDGDNAMQELSVLRQNPLFLGIRPMLQDMQDPAWILKPELQPVFHMCVEKNLRFDALIKPVQLPHLLKLLQRHTNLRVVVDHGAKPNIGGAEWQPWADLMEQLAKDTSAYCKISGLITETRPDQSYEDVFPYMRHLLDVFGVDRLMWGSDWPVLNLRGDYAGWHAAMQQFLAPLEERQKHRIEGLNAATFYGLPAASAPS